MKKESKKFKVKSRDKQSKTTGVCHSDVQMELSMKKKRKS